MNYIKPTELYKSASRTCQFHTITTFHKSHLFTFVYDRQTDSEALVIGSRFTIWVQNPKKADEMKKANYQKYSFSFAFCLKMKRVNKLPIYFDNSRAHNTLGTC